MAAKQSSYRPTSSSSSSHGARSWGPYSGSSRKHQPSQAPSTTTGKTLKSDPAQLAALEQLLRTVAERAQNMSTQEILALNTAFATAGSGSSAPLTVPPAVAQASSVGTSLLDAIANSSGPEMVSPRTSSRGDAVSQLSVFQPETAPGPLPTLEEVGGGLNTVKGPLPTLEEVGWDLNIVKVSSRANVKSVAGAISKSLRGHDMLVATAVGPDGTNQGMKALSIARCYLAAEGLDLSATVVEVQPDTALNGPGHCYAFVVVRIQVPAKTGEPLCEAGVGRTEPMPRFVRPEGSQTEMKVSGVGNASTLGGAIAKCLREDREAVITAVGPAAVAKCVEAMALARSYVWNDGLQLAFYPGFEHIIMQGVGPSQGEQRSCVRVHVWPEIAQPE